MVVLLNARLTGAHDFGRFVRDSVRERRGNVSKNLLGR